MKTLCLFSLAAMATITQAAVHAYADTPFAFRQTIVDGSGVDIEDSSTFKNLANWEVNTTVSEADSVDDWLGIAWGARHVNPPHGEGPNMLTWIGNFDVNAENYVEGNGYVLKDSGVVRHGDHCDKFATRLTFDITESTFDWDQIPKYSYIAVGKHTDNYWEYLDFDTTLTSSNELPGNDSTALGNLIFEYNTITQTYGITMAVVGISKNQILGARLYVGPKGQNGTPIADIASGARFIDQGPHACVLMIDQLNFPWQYAALLKKGQLYINLHTQNYPNGEIRGQLGAMRNLSNLH